ncbi:hypothetical protein AGDE_12968 [Angomonas deanei]|nr:hypothetical protein AGDE_12968 [Angomonas deanei]|eukprot:EPY23281.1 hypothetical protein AGDE_12968 [Angomonas deanei]
MDGENAFIRQRSHGVLCSIDLAGSERVNDSGVQGKELKEAININTSLLNLGKCMYALRSLNTNSNSNVVIPWRQSKLTYFLQHYLTGQGSKLLLIVNISNHRKHAAESLNSLRFAQRVSEVIVGPSGKRVSAY